MVDQKNPRDCYVYGHSDPSGKLFYIGKGSGRRAWSRDRDRIWNHYVNTCLHGDYRVVILADGLTSEAAEALEEEWIDRENEGLINRQNMARSIDLAELTRRDELMNRAKSLTDKAISCERTNREQAIAYYKEAYSLLKLYSRIQFESGLYGEIMSKMNNPIGNIRLLDRLTLCLVRQGRANEAREITAEYFGIFKSERSLVSAKRILKRVDF